jgi:hypothetical protein
VLIVASHCAWSKTMSNAGGVRMGDSFAMNFVPMTPKKLRFNLKDDPDKT